MAIYAHSEDSNEIKFRALALEIGLFNRSGKMQNKDKLFYIIIMLVIYHYLFKLLMFFGSDYRHDFSMNIHCNKYSKFHSNQSSKYKICF